MNQALNADSPLEPRLTPVLAAQATPPLAPDAAQTGQDAAVQPQQGHAQAEQPVPNAEPSDQHPAPAPDNTIKVPEEPRPCAEQCQSDSSPSLEFWNGEKLLCNVIGLVLKTDCRGLKPRMVAVSDCYTTYMVRPPELKEFLLQHADRMLLFHDGVLADRVLRRMFVKNIGVPTALIQSLKGHVYDIASWVTALRMLDLQNVPPSLELCQILIGHALSRLPPEHPAKAHMRGLLNAGWKDGRGFLTASAMAVAATYYLCAPLLQDREDIAALILANTAKVFSWSRQTMQDVIDKRQRVIDKSQLAKMRLYMHIIRSAHRASRRGEMAEDYWDRRVLTGRCAAEVSGRDCNG